MENANYHIEQICPHVTLIDDATGSSSWLITGEKAALLIDTGWCEGDFAALIRTLTDLPVSLFISHAHIDHYKHVPEFEHAYIHRADWTLLPEFRKNSNGAAPLQSQLTPVDEGFCFDLGGAKATVYLAAGHTPGSAVIAVPEYQCAFTGDAFGSGIGVWMQVPMGLTTSEYRNALDTYLNTCAFTRDYRYCGGHYEQGRENPLCYALVEDLRTLCDLLLSGDEKTANVQKSDTNRFTPEQGMHASYGRAAMEYLKSRLR